MSAPDSCLFCHIVDGTIPSRQVHADEHAVAFLDINGWHRGHTLVIPRRHVDDLVFGPAVLPELAPAIDWDKGRAVLYLVDVLGLDSADTVPVYLGDDITDEDAFRALRGRGIGILVGRPDDPEMAGRTTAAEFALASVDEVERFLTTLAR